MLMQSACDSGRDSHAGALVSSAETAKAKTATSENSVSFFIQRKNPTIR